jgi:anti-anti-sigma factor
MPALLVRLMMTAPMEIRTRDAGGVSVVDVTGRLVLSESESDTLLRNTVAGLLRDGQQRFVVNLGAVTDVDTTGLTALVAAHLIVTRANGRITFAEPSDRVRHVLRVTRLDAVFVLAESEHDALVQLQPGVRPT